MTVRGIVAALVVALPTAVLPVAAPAQVTLAPPPADSTLAEDPFALPPTGWRQTLVLRATARRYDTDAGLDGAFAITEQAGLASYVLRGRRVALRLDLSPLGYRAAAVGGTTTSVRGLTPAQVRIDWRWRDGDTTRLTLRSGSRPAVLDTAASQAIGAAGTNTLDLEAVAFGAQPQLALRHATSFAVDDEVSVGLRFGAETSPAPVGTDLAFWTGTTLRGGVSLQRKIGAYGGARLSADVSRSFADDLGGRNLFPGGGSLQLDARTQGMLDGDEGRWYGSAQAFWVRPFQNPDADQLTRLIPQGQFGGVNLLLSGEFGDWSIGPLVSLVRESSTADARFTVTAPLGGRPLAGTLTKDGSGWSATVGGSVTRAIGAAFDVTVEAAAVRGGVSLLERETLTGPGGRRFVRTNASRATSIGGGWVALEVAVRW